MTQSVALVDYYNLPRPQRARGELNYLDHQGIIDKLIDNLAAAAREFNNNTTDLKIRLYGGWSYDVNGSTTTDRDMLISILHRSCPTRSRGIRIRAELAESLIAVSFNFPNTMRVSPGLIPIPRMNGQPSSCHEGTAACKLLSDLNEWRRNRCPKKGCEVKTEHILETTRQKMVDSMIVSDAIYICAEEKQTLVALVSNDDDIIPGALTAGKLTKGVSLVRIGRKKQCIYDPILEKEGVQIMERP